MLPAHGLSDSPQAVAERAIADTDSQSNATYSPSSNSGKRKLVGFGAKKTLANTSKEDEMAGTSAIPAVTTTPADLSASPRGSRDSSYTSALPQHGQQYSSIGSPTKQFRSPSPRPQSPASSMIFERSVQETTISSDLGPAIPSHIQTEDHIPPVLEASSLAITDDHLNLDDVEIVMHSAHLPAAAAVAGASSLDATFGMSSLDDLVAPHPVVEDPASGYGSLDSSDVRRLSFISFADVMQAEHAESGKDAGHQMSISSATPPMSHRSPSPLRSPIFNHGVGASPPLSGESSPVRGTRVHAPSAAHSPPPHGELTIETMRQALEKTGSGDLGGAWSHPASSMSSELGFTERP